MENKELVFIYNADSDLRSQAKDLTLKITKGKTACSLCNATWAIFDKKKYWSEKEKKIQIPYRYLHRDQLDGDIKSYLDQNNKSHLTMGVFYSLNSTLSDHRFGFWTPLSILPVIR